MINLLTTNSYFNMFDLLIEQLSQKPNGIDNKNVVFCEEKVSLMIERMISNKLKGSFNTKVYSFGNFLRCNKPMDNLLTKEGSAMVVKNILSTAKLNCFKASKESIAPTLYDLFIQLKSAKITPNDILNAIDNTNGVLKNKLADIYTVYSGYEDFIAQNRFEDQSSVLSYLPQVILQSEYLSGASIYIVGFSGFTAQIRSAIDALCQKNNDITAILCEGDNRLVFVNETAEYIKSLAKQNDYPFIYKQIDSDYNGSARAILDNLFNPFVAQKDKTSLQNTNIVYCASFVNMINEVERVGQTIKSLVISGECRYRDITIAIPDQKYNGYIKSVFTNLDIPYFLDERKKPLHHPLIKLVVGYIDIFRKNFERKTVLAFIKNPYFCQDKNLLDRLENYIIKYNINYSRLMQPFTLCDKDDNDSQKLLLELNCLMDKFRAIFEKFDVNKTLDLLGVENLCQVYTQNLNEQGLMEESAINSQIYTAIKSILAQMGMLLGQVTLSLNEYRNVFISGISALELSIIPQYNDAVFVGDYKQTALAKARHLFAISLTSSVPDVRADVSLLSDSDIDALEQIKILIEPKINIVNHRIRENVALALCAFDKNLYLSYPTSSEEGGVTVKSEIVATIEKILPTTPFINHNGYLTKKQGLKTFARECGEFADGMRTDFVNASSYYQTVKDHTLVSLLNRADKEIKKTLDSSRQILIEDQTSPTTIEDYYRCPYRLFLSRALKLKQREEGKVDVLSVGNLMHEIFCIYAKNMNKVSDLQTSNQVFESAKEQVLSRQEYKRYLLDSATKMTVERVLSECKKYCYKTFVCLEKSKYTIKNTEVGFGDGQTYPAISLLDGKVKLKGKIDRVDESQNHFRVIDYKTGSTDSTDKGLFSGTKLQLFLYGKAVGDKYKNGEKGVAGLYYLPVADNYVKIDQEKEAMADGRTLEDIEAIKEQDLEFFDNGVSEFLPNKLDSKGKVKNALSKQDIENYINYAVGASELAVQQLKDGIIVPSPYAKACEYCEYKGLCPSQDTLKRELGTVKQQSITGVFDTISANELSEGEQNDK